MQTETRLKARYSETDQMGIIHHSSYINWFEVGRIDFIRQLGKPYHQLEEEGLLLPVLAAHVDYHAPAKSEEEIIIHTKMIKYNSIRLTLYYEAYKTDGTKVVTGYTEHCWANEKLNPFSLKRRESALHYRLLDALEDS